MGIRAAGYLGTSAYWLLVLTIFGSICLGSRGFDRERMVNGNATWRVGSSDRSVPTSSRGPHDATQLDLQPWLTVGEDFDYELIDLDGEGTDIVLVSQLGERTVIKRIDGTPWDRSAGSLLWEQVWSRDPMSTKLQTAAPFRWRPPRQILFSSRPTKKSAQLARPAPDIDGDGTGDLVWFTRDQAGATTIAFSGSSGERLWSVAHPQFSWTRLLAAPLIADIDQDKLPDIIQCYVDPHGSTWLEAISGLEGNPIWRCSVSADDRSDNETPAIINPRPCAIVTIAGKSWIAVEDRLRVRFFSTQSGEPSHLSITPPGLRFQAADFEDLDGDGNDEAILFREHNPVETAAGLPKFSISVWDPVETKSQWIGRVSPEMARRRGHRLTRMLSHRRADGHREFLMADQEHASLALQRIVSTSGQHSWRESHRLSLNPTALAGEASECGDIDRDGVREIIVVSLDEAKRRRNQSAVFIDVLSGATGRRLHSMVRPLPSTHSIRLRDATIIQLDDADDHLIVATSQTNASGGADRENGVHVDIWSPGTGEMIASITEVNDIQLCDFDGDGQQSFCVARVGYDTTTLSVARLSPGGTEAWNASQAQSPFELAYLKRPDYEVLTAETDPRWLEPLPWTRFFADKRTVSEPSSAGASFSLWGYIGLAQLAFLGIFLIPCWAVMGSLVKGQWSLIRWLMLPAVVGLAMTSCSLFAAHEQTATVARYVGVPPMLMATLISLFGGSLLLLPLELAVLLLRRHFRSVVALLAVITISSVAVGTAWAWPTWAGLDAEVRFDWTGWYWIWIYAAYLTGWAYLVAIGIYNLSIDSRRSREPIRLT